MREIPHAFRNKVEISTATDFFRRLFTPALFARSNEFARVRGLFCAHISLAFPALLLSGFLLVASRFREADHARRWYGINARTTRDGDDIAGDSILFSFTLATVFRRDGIPRTRIRALVNEIGRVTRMSSKSSYGTTRGNENGGDGRGDEARRNDEREITITRGIAGRL